MTPEKVHMLRCASSFGVAAYTKIRLTSQDLRALPLDLFAASSIGLNSFNFLNFPPPLSSVW